MSAYMVNDDTLDLLASISSWTREGLWIYAKESTYPPRSLIETAAGGISYKSEHSALIKVELALENRASLRARYGADESNLSATVGKFNRIYDDQATVGEALGALRCYEYQACESDQWNDSYAKLICDSIRKSLCDIVCGDGWEYTRPTGITNRVSMMDLLK